MSERHALSKEWAPYRDPKTGEVVTITWEQVAAVLHAVRIVDEVRATQHRVTTIDGVDYEHENPPLRKEAVPEKSRALGRLLIDGKALFEEIPPYDMGAAAYGSWDAENAQ